MSFPSYGESFPGQQPPDANNGSVGSQGAEGQPPLGSMEAPTGQFPPPSAGAPGGESSVGEGDGGAKTTLW